MLVEKEIVEEKSMEGIVRRLERDIGEEFRHLPPTLSVIATSEEAVKVSTAAQPDGVPDHRVPAAAVSEIEKMEFENK